MGEMTKQTLQAKEYCEDCEGRKDVSHTPTGIQCKGCGAILAVKQPLKVHMPHSVNFQHDQQEPPAEKAIDSRNEAQSKAGGEHLVFKPTKV